MKFNFLNLIKGSLSSEEIIIINHLSQEYSSWERNLSIQERYLIRKYTYNSHDDSKPNRFFERLNRAIRGEYSGNDTKKLIRYGEIISEAICRHPLTFPTTCYRGVDQNLLQNIEIGTVFSFDQFISTSIIERCALNKKYKYVIFAPRGTNGAYIENLSAFKGQFEFLLDYNCRFKLVDRQGRLVYLEVVV